MLQEFQLLQEVEADTIEVFGDLWLVNGRPTKWKDDILRKYFDHLAAMRFAMIWRNNAREEELLDVVYLLD